MHQKCCCGIMAQVHLYSREVLCMVVVVNPLDVCTDSIFTILVLFYAICSFCLAENVISGNYKLLMLVLSEYICCGYKEFLLVFFHISFFNRFLLCKHINCHKTGKFQSQEAFPDCMIIIALTVS